MSGSSDNNEESVESVSLVTLIRINFLLPLVCSIVCGALAFTYGMLATKLYKTETVVIPVAEIDGGGLGSLAGNLGAVASIAGIGVSQDERQIEAIATINSNAFLSEFITSRKLLPLLLKDDWDESSQEWVNAPSINKAVTVFSKEVFFFSQDAGTGICTISMVWHDPEQAAVWARQIVQDLNMLLRERAVADTTARIEYLEDELEKTQIVPVSTAISSLMEKQVHRRMLANVTADYAFRVIDPAVVPDLDDPYTPKKILLLAAGLLLGAVLGVLLVLVRITRVSL